MKAEKLIKYSKYKAFCIQRELERRRQRKEKRLFFCPLSLYFHCWFCLACHCSHSLLLGRCWFDTWLTNARRKEKGSADTSQEKLDENLFSSSRPFRFVQCLYRYLLIMNPWFLRFSLTHSLTYLHSELSMAPLYTDAFSSMNIRKENKVTEPSHIHGHPWEISFFFFLIF